jgi:hypothetical protein
MNRYVAEVVGKSPSTLVVEVPMHRGSLSYMCQQLCLRKTPSAEC